jgi:hypothetical protein
LRRARLLAQADPDDPNSLDCHPLLREYFGEGVRASNPEAWREAHSRLYEYYKNRAKEYPETLAEMAPLYAAAAHGCQAGRHQEARGNKFFNTKELGALGAELAVLSGFFDPPWGTLMDGLREESKGFVLNEAGYDLQALGRLAEAAQPMQAALETAIALEMWDKAALSASNLSELTLTGGDLAQALAYARQSVELAERSGDAFHRMSKRTTLADALHQAGSFGEAKATFYETEEIQKEDQPDLPLLYSLPGSRYCGFLLSQGQWQEVQSRASQTLELAKESWYSVLSIALDNLSLGRAYSVETQYTLTPTSLWSSQGEREQAFTQAIAHLNRAVEGLRQAGTHDHLPSGLLARAELRRVMSSLGGVRRDLDEAFAIATRGGMRLHEADCHLEYARWYLAARDNKEQARASLARAKQMIEEMGYHRRDREVEELDHELLERDEKRES